MAWMELGARAHAFVNNFGRPSEVSKTAKMVAATSGALAEARLSTQAGRDKLIDLIAASALEPFGLDCEHPQFSKVQDLVKELAAFEGLFVLPDQATLSRSDMKSLSLADHWELRNELIRQDGLLKDLDQTCEFLRLIVCSLLDPLYEACPALKDSHGQEVTSQPALATPPSGDLVIPSSLLHMVPRLGTIIDQMAKSFFAEDLVKAKLFERMRGVLEYRLIEASGGNPADPAAFKRQAKFATTTQDSYADPAELVSAYLGGTPLVSLFNQSVNFRLPTKVRFEHHHIVAGSGHGKTQTLQQMIVHDLDAVARGDRSIVVIDSQSDLIQRIASLDCFAPGGALEGRLVLIDPTDIEYPVSLNLFDVGQHRLAGYSPLERERLTNSILELYDFVLGSLLDADMTQKQSVIFRYVTRLMLHIPDATIHTLLRLMEPDGEQAFADSIAKLTGTARHFFETEFTSKEFAATKKQVLRRLWGILENQTFERMFSHPKSKLDLYSEMNAGKVILVNTAKDLLKEAGTQIFGRFFIALIAQAAQERSVIPEAKRMPTFVYVDEAADYFDRNIGVILSQARKYKVGMVLAHQYLGQLEGKLQEAFAANTSIKFAGKLSAKDARVMAAEMGAAATMFENQPKFNFAASVDSVTKGAVPITITPGLMETLPKASKEHQATLRQEMRQRYAEHYANIPGHGSRGESKEAGSQETPTTETPTPEVSPDKQVDLGATEEW